MKILKKNKKKTYSNIIHDFRILWSRGREKGKDRVILRCPRDSQFQTRGKSFSIVTSMHDHIPPLKE